ncbi:hypothetical protein U9M48_002516 [Paspalum notatum var. saurae]|uniref:RING-type domain-containing protein n=1 Tax=Paspalum notatum var. saurae TaxID=547442 RepID=A0AAQ3PRH6_PASNO
MAVQAQFSGLAGCLPPYYGSGLAEDQAQAQALLQYNLDLYNCAAGVASAAQSELTFHGGGAVPLSRKHVREHADHQPHAPTPSPAAVPLSIPATHTHRPIVGTDRPSSATASTSGRPVPGSSAADAPVAELCRQGCAEEVDALVRAECDRLRAGVDQASKRQRQALARRAAAGAARALREKEAALDTARRRAAGLEELLRRAAAERHAWRGVARSNEAAAAGLRATLDALLLRAAGAGAPADEEEEGFGESCQNAAAADDAVSCCFVEKAEAPARGWACRACGAGEASVLVLPCRHLCLCKACEPRADACPVCLAAKNASIHVAAAAD